MKIYERYITKNLLLSILVVVIILATIIWLTQSIRYLTLISNSGIDFISFIKLSLLLIPSYIQILFPVSTFIGVIFYYHKLYVDSEFLILKSSGLSNLQLYKPAIYASIILMIVNYLFSIYIMPYCAKNFREKIVNFKDSYINLLLEEGVFNNKIKNLTIYVEKQLPDNLFKNILIYDLHNPDNEITIIAEYGHVYKNNNVIEFNFLNGNKHEIDKNKKISVLKFDSLSYNISLEGQYKRNNTLEPNEKYINELIEAYHKTRSNKIFVEINQRFNWPIYNLIFGLLGLNIFEFSYIRKNFSLRSVIIGIFALLIVIIYFLSNNLALYSKFFIILIYLQIILLLLAEIYILFYRQYIIKHSKKCITFN